MNEPTSSKSDPCPGPITCRNSKGVGLAMYSLDPLCPRVRIYCYFCAYMCVRRSILPGTPYRTQKHAPDAANCCATGGLPHAFPTVESYMQRVLQCTTAACDCRRLVVADRSFPFLALWAVWTAAPVRSFFHCSGLIADGRACLTADPGRQPPFLPGDNTD